MSNHTTTVSNTLIKYVGDLIALDKHILDAIEGQLNSRKINEFPTAHRTLAQASGVLRSGIVTLEQHLSSIGSDPGTPVKKVVSAIAGAAASVIDRVRPSDEVSKMLRDTYTALSLDAISSTMLHTTALAMDEDRTAQLALAHLKNITPLIMEISQVMPEVVEQELVRDNSDVKNTNIAKKSLVETHKAWTR
ncbi:MAG: hypothetical protein HC822_09655 [Oscillochloris sp.]|nr:hypothetical protein [Oscillochloris sp.]